MAMRTALYAKFMAQMPERVKQPKSQKPEPYDDPNNWYCDFSKMDKFHYVFDAGYSKAEKNDQVE
jgi:hypothetical protein